MENRDYCVYILRCSDQCLYTGITNQLEHRIKAHNLGKASKFTRTRLPVDLVYLEQGYTRGEALARELAIKNLKRNQKLLLIAAGDNPKPI